MPGRPAQEVLFINNWEKYYRTRDEKLPCDAFGRAKLSDAKPNKQTLGEWTAAEAGDMDFANVVFNNCANPYVHRARGHGGPFGYLVAATVDIYKGSVRSGATCMNFSRRTS